MTQLGWFRYQKIRTRKNSRFNSFYRFNFLPRQTNVVEVDTFDPFVISITAQIAGLCQQVIIMFWSWRRKQIILKMNLSWAEHCSRSHIYISHFYWQCQLRLALGGASSDTSWMQFKSILFLIAFHDTDKNPPIYPSYQTCTAGISTAPSPITICKYHSQVSKGVNVNVIPWNTIFRAYYRLLFAECTLCLVPFIYFHA